ncbi:MAG: hypothetical protein OSJ62_12855 [Lachnospiraceae bacterium]|nr:hypothetical protein [Lachnospiraceae bacterium]
MARCTKPFHGTIEDGTVVLAAGEVLTIHSDIYNDEVYAFAVDGHMLTQVSSRDALV